MIARRSYLYLTKSYDFFPLPSLRNPCLQEIFQKSLKEFSLVVEHLSILISNTRKSPRGADIL